MQYEAYMHKKADDERNGIKHTEHSEEELLNMIKRVREQSNGG